MTDTERKTGRPKLAPEERRDHRLPAPRVTLAELHFVQQRAAAAGMPLADFMRLAVTGTAPRRRAQPKADSALLYELNKLGVNLNQIARAVNRGRDLPPEFAEILAQIHTAVLKLDEAEHGS